MNNPYAKFADEQRSYGKIFYQLFNLGYSEEEIGSLEFELEGRLSFNFSKEIFAIYVWLPDHTPYFNFYDEVGNTRQAKWFDDHHPTIAETYLSDKSQKTEEHVHVDDFTLKVYHKTPGDQYAAWFFFLKRLAACYEIMWDQYIKQYKLFCTYNGKRYRVTGASRMGDVWLSADFNREVGYELRVYLDECTDWSEHE